jgi:beta-glucosidase
MTRRISLCIGLFLISLATTVSQSLKPLPAHSATERSIDSLVARMTLEEKVGQLVQLSGRFDTGPAGRTNNERQSTLIREGKVGSLLNVIGASETHELQRIAVEESRLKIPLLFGLDVIHGFRTIFPIPLATAASWNPAAVEGAERIAAAEAASVGIHWTFAPMVDIARDPRWGRVAEGSGEDPYLGSVMAAARVRGFQGKDLSDPNSIMACAKHFAAYGAAEGGRDYNTVDISERTLRDVYLPPFKAAVEAGVGTLMSSFNEIAGVPNTGNSHLLTEILRGEWKFDGFVVSDWNSIDELIAHGFAESRGDAAQKAINAGLDMDMASRCFNDTLATLVKAKSVSTKTVDEAVRRVLRMKYRLGLFADPYRHRSSVPDTVSDPKHMVAAREIARESIVLLRNEGSVLPLPKDRGTIAVIGPLANNHRDPIGPWAWVGDSNRVVTVLDGLRNAATGARLLYAKGCTIRSLDTSGFAEAIDIARQADVVILAMGESRDMSGEAASRSSLTLPGCQEDLARRVQAMGKPVILVLMNGRPLAISWEAENIPAILETWFLGQQSGNAIADVLFGDYNPSGRLPITFPRATGQVPIYYSHKNTGRPFDPKLHFSSQYMDLSSTPLYPFGFGLSYTTFDYAGLSIQKNILGLNDTLVVSVEVKNTGIRSGDEVVQLYVRDEVGSVTRPVRELKAFTKVRISAGTSEIVHLSVPIEQLAFTGLDMRTRVEPGSFRVFVGPNCTEGLEGAFTVIDH